MVINNNFSDLSDDKLQMIVFKLGTEEYALPIQHVQEIIRKQTPSKLPKSFDYVEGIINLRGHIIAIIDGKKRVQSSSDSTSSENDSRVIILDVDNQTIGLIVDSVSEVVQLTQKNIEAPPVNSSESNEFLWGIGKVKERLLLLLDPQKLLLSNNCQNYIKNHDTSAV